ncbi:substrate-binding periplasmic protein [Bowmanella pacifica]|uniref:ABC transporter substrate-binding protein n=1 Tax=Bowmanella pacifica TaxID=502051 RepID=A0A917YWG3_9ALTE|nr:transporter substrate-binding domain-containing protein [Bowmanella pacifica]GGO67352.1 hypothetical protein GCM10010982_13600 [Bowmanella pacifica]
MTRYLVYLCMAIAGFQVWAAGPAQRVIYTYHADPPFYLPEQPTDLSRAWVTRFNQFQSEVHLQVKHIARAQLNGLIESGQSYLVLWANPLFFQSKDPALLASEAIFWDADILVSRVDNPVEYHHPTDLTGLRLGGRQGFYYRGINELVAQEKLTRQDAVDDYQNYQRLLNKQIDAFIMQRSAFCYWQGNGLNAALLYVAEEPHDAYSRHVLASVDNQDVLSAINAFIRAEKADPQWRALLMKWGVEGLMNPFELELEELLEADIDKQN